MAEEPFLLVSLEEAKAQKLAQVLQNETCTKLLNHLARHKEGTESELAKRLNLPLSTVHYNLKQLVQAKLVVADEYHYSEKGREVLHYKLANKYIIIAPQEDRGGFIEKLQRLLPAAAIVAGVALVLKAIGLLTGTASFTGSPEAALGKRAPLALPERAADEAVAAARSFAEEATTDAASLGVANGTNVTPLPSPMPDPPSLIPGGCIEPTLRERLLSDPAILAFLAAGLLALLLVALVARLRKRRG